MLDKVHARTLADPLKDIHNQSCVSLSVLAHGHVGRGTISPVSGLELCGAGFY